MMLFFYYTCELCIFLLLLSSSILSTVPICSSEDVSGGDEVTLPEDQSRSNIGSPVSDADSGNPLDCCRNFGVVQSHGSSFSPEEPLLQQDPPSLPTVPVSSYYA